jgi:hypothetical protein
VVDEEHIKDDIADACFHQTWMKNAPVHLVIVSDVDRLGKMYGERGEKLYCHHNAAAMTENVLIAAANHGLCTCWVGAFNEEKISQILSIPENYIPEVVITVGYPDEEPPAPVKQSLDALVFLNGWTHSNNIPFLMKDYADVFQYHMKRVKKSVTTSGKKVGKKFHEHINDHIKKFKDSQKKKEE